MLNCPGWNRGLSPPWSGSSTSVTVSAVSRVRLRTTYGTGTRDCPRTEASAPANATASVAMNVQELKLRVLEPLRDEREQVQEELVAVRGVLVEQRTEDVRIDGESLRWLHCTSVQAPPVRGRQPRPADHFARPDGLDREAGTGRHHGLERNLPGDDQEELSRRFAFPEQDVSGRIGTLDRHPAHRGHERRRQFLDERMVGEEGGSGGRVRLRHAFAGADWDEATGVRIAATSSVRSMPTGHQVMHRPHPTHPDIPN